MEYLQVFDKNKKPLKEQVERSIKDSLDDNKYYMVTLIFIQNDENKFLLQKTSKAKGSCIATTGGHVKYNDTSVETIIRECEEEIGIEFNKDDLMYVDSINDGYCFIDIYYTKNNIDISSVKLQVEEVESINWYSVGEIRKLIKNNKFRESNIEAFNKVLDYKNINKN
jgi:8-oxo-dGTP pyrophosphatase MutT (NUDIX family)